MTNNKRKNFDVGDMVVITHELTSPVYVVAGVKGSKLGVIDMIRALVVPGTVPIWLDAELFELPMSFQLARYQLESARIERAMLTRNLSENLPLKKCDGNHAAPICDDVECWRRE